MAEEHIKLANRCLAGDVDALREFIELFQQRVFMLCLRMLRQRQDAEDTAQESLLRAVRYLKSWDSTQPLAPWVLKIAANRCRTALSQRQRIPIPSEFSHEQVDQFQPPPLGLAEELHQALDVLNDRQRECFVLFYQKDLSITEISETMQVPKGTIKTWLHRSRKELAERLQERGMTPD